jgi:hypothetical protein
VDATGQRMVMHAKLQLLEPALITKENVEVCMKK